MAKKKIINIFLLLCIFLLIFVGIKVDLLEKLIDYSSKFNLEKQNISKDSGDYPDHIYETFINGKGKEISVKMEKKIGTIDGEQVVFYEDTIGSEIIKYHFYKGIVKSIDTEKVIIIVDEECLNADPEKSFYQYTDVKNYEITFYLDNYKSKNNEYGIEDRISINTFSINSNNELQGIIGKYMRVCDSKYKDLISGLINCQLDFFFN